jgi:hypothetical protein
VHAPSSNTDFKFMEYNDDDFKNYLDTVRAEYTMVFGNSQVRMWMLYSSLDETYFEELSKVYLSMVEYEKYQ